MFEKLRYLNERSTKFESLYQEYKYLEEENGKMVALEISPKIESLYGLGRQATKFQLKCLDFQSNQYNKLVRVLSRFCNWVCEPPRRLS